MKEKTIDKIEKIKTFRQTYEWETFYKVWLSLSWVFLIMGYAFGVVNATLFAGDPQMAKGLGMFMISVTTINVIPMIINLFMLIYLIWKEEGWYYYREFFLITTGYLVVFTILWKAAIAGL